MYSRTVRTRVLATGAALSLVAGFLTVLSPATSEPADAADMSTFDPGMIITDETFYNSGTMTVSEIQSFMEAKDPDCVDYKLSDGTDMMCIQKYKAKVTARAANSNCSAIEADNSDTASSILYIMAKACGVNPQVLLVLIQKEEDLILNAHSEGRYRIVAGYGCPDTAACNTKYYGYANQLYNAAYSFKQWSRPLVRQYMPGRYNTIRYSPNKSCGSASVYIKNYATAALYTYTPYVPNKAALKSSYGSGDSCSAYGNRNFYSYFYDWFGNPGNLLKNASFTFGTSPWTSGSTGTMAISGESDVDLAQSGSKYVTVLAASAGRRVQQTVSRKSSIGQIYSGGLWLRADDDAATASGEVLMWTSGGTLEVARVPFTVANEWTYVPIDLAINHSGHKALRVGVQLATPNVKVRVDTTSLFLKGTNSPRASIPLEESKAGSGYNKGWLLSSKSALTLKRVKGNTATGKYHASLKNTATGAYIGQLVSRSVKSNTAYTFGVWVRSPDAEPYSGHIRIAATGGTTETMTTDFTVGSEWTYVTVTLDVLLNKHSKVRVYIHPDEVGRTLYYDGPTLMPNLNVTDPSFDVDATGGITAPDGVTVEQIPADESTGPAADGTGMLRVTRTTDDPGYIQLDAARKIGVGETYTAQVWVRSATPGTPHTGVLTLEGLASTLGTDTASTAFTATDTWQLVTVSLTTTLAGLTSLRTTVSMDANGDALYIDGAQLY
jgi:hypothetical protein